METSLYLLASFVVQVLSGALTAGLILVIGGAGVLRSLHRRLLITEERIEDTDERITKEVKRRAAIKALEARDAAPKTPKQMAEEHLGTQTPIEGRNTRPSVVSTSGIK